MRPTEGAALLYKNPSPGGREAAVQVEGSRKADSERASFTVSIGRDITDVAMPAAIQANR
jgi:hypothetical protein